MSKQFLIALILSILLHALLLLLDTKREPSIPLRESVLELVDIPEPEEPDETPVIEAPKEEVLTQPTPPIPVLAEPEDLPQSNEPTELVQKVDSLPPPILENTPTPVIATSENPRAQNTGIVSTVKGSGDSEGQAEVGSAQLDNRDFKPYGNAKPHYPEVARRLNIEGEVSLEILIAGDGTVESITVLQVKGHPSFADAARETAKKWRFAPPRYQGKAVKARYKRVIAFQLF